MTERRLHPPIAFAQPERHQLTIAHSLPGELLRNVLELILKMVAVFESSLLDALLQGRYLNIVTEYPFMRPVDSWA